jgi:hypothetical protein
MSDGSAILAAIALCSGAAVLEGLCAGRNVKASFAAFRGGKPGRARQ